MKPIKAPRSNVTALADKKKTHGGETHQTTSSEPLLTTDQGLALSDNQNSLKAGPRGSTLLEDFILREKITHFDHERIPERIVHARGSAAHGYFQPYKSMKHVTSAAFLADPKVRTPVFARFSTVAGGAGSVDLPRDVRGFAVKFYTQEGNFDLVGNNIPGVFIQDAMKFPDLIHSVKMEADRGFPQAASAHDTFWDFISLMPESLHMIMWAMSDRAIPRSLRMMEGFGVNTYRLVNAAGETNFVKFHWRPVLGTASVLWDEAVKICGADPDFHRRDLFEERFRYRASRSGNWASRSSIKRPPTPCRSMSLMRLSSFPKRPFRLRWQAGWFWIETPITSLPKQSKWLFAQVTLFLASISVKILFFRAGFFSYLDTQITRLGTPNFHQLPINAPKCPYANFQRDAKMQMRVPSGRDNYEPNSLSPAGPRESNRGFHSAPVQAEGTKTRLRPESFSDHYSQARLFYRSVTPQEQRHIAKALTFELSKVDIVEIRRRMLGHLDIIESTLGDAVADGLGMPGEALKIIPAAMPIDLKPSPALRLYGKYEPTLKGRKVGVLLASGFDPELKNTLVAAIEKEGATAAIIAPKVGGAEDSAGKKQPAAMALSGSPSVLFDAVAVLAGPVGDKQLSADPDCIGFMMDACRHLKVIGLFGRSGPGGQNGFDRRAGRPGVEVVEGYQSLY